jgi:tetratricopeptide (TPR) repeat protein
MTRSRRAVLAALFVIAFADPVLAQPTLWQRVAKPHAVAEAKLLASLERMLDSAKQNGMFELGLDREIARGAVAMIELSGVTEPTDPSLVCVEAEAFIEADIGREADARRLLESALERLSPGTRAAQAWNTLAAALGRLDDSKTQYRAYTKVIELTWNSETRALAFYNRGEVTMREHDLAGARADYLKAVAEAREPSLVALSRYGLAVAEERLGDLPAAYAVLDKAVLVRLPVPPFPAEDPLDLPGVFFVPPYEENYIRALRAMAVGRRSTDPEERRDAYETAVAQWDTYLAQAAEDEPFLENARAHRARSQRELDRIPAPHQNAPHRGPVRR